MREKVIAIYENETDYVRELSGYLSRNTEFPCRVAAFTNEEAFGRYIETEKPDVMLLGEECTYGVDASETECIRLSSEKKAEHNGPWIFKYQSAGNIVREITAYMDHGESYEIQDHSVKIYTVFSPKAGVERSEYARALAKDLGQNGEVLYVDLDPFSGDEQDNEDAPGMSEAVYYLKQGGEQTRWKIKGLINVRCGMRCLTCVHCSMDLIELKAEDAAELISIFREMKELSAVVLDVGFYSEAMLEICHESDAVYLISPKGEEYKRASDRFVKQLKIMQRDSIIKKMEIVAYGEGRGRSGYCRSEAGYKRAVVG